MEDEGTSDVFADGDVVTLMINVYATENLIPAYVAEWFLGTAGVMMIIGALFASPWLSIEDIKSLYRALARRR